MKKNINYLLFVFVFIGCSFLYIPSSAQHTPADSLLNFIDANRTRVAFYLSKNDDPIATLNQDKVMPLAQVTNIMIAVEFAQQATHGNFDENNNVALSDVNRFYLPILDSISRLNWLKDENEQQNIKNDSISLLEVARGMIIYNCNANAEFLLDVLGFDNVASNVHVFGLKKHTAIFPLVSSLFVFQNNKKYSQKKFIKSVKHLSEKKYCKAIFNIHQSLKNDTSFKSTFIEKDFNNKMQKLWNDKLTTSTAKEYADVASTLNNRRLFTSIAYQIFAEIVESYMEDPERQKILKHAGLIAGTTPSIFNKVVYGTTSDNKKIEMVYFFNNLTEDENDDIRRWSEDFDYKVLTNNRFRSKIGSALSGD